MPTWPTSNNIPQKPSPDGYVEVPGSVSLRTEMDVGPAKGRRRYTEGIDTYKWVFALDSNAAVTAFKDFYRTVGEHFTFDFTAGNPRTGAAEDFRFVKPPVIRARGGNEYTVSVEVEVIP